jgi:uncharacterized membrane protein (DUF106 family)
MAAAPPPAARPKSGSFLTILSFGAVFFILFDSNLRTQLGTYAGYVLDPTIGFGGRYPVLTVLLSGALLVVATTLIRHFTTDWLEMAKMQAQMRHFQREMMQAKKDNNSYKIKILTDAQPQVMAQNQKMQSAQLKQMPLTMLIAVPIFAWVSTWLIKLDYTFFASPWNPSVDMFTTNGIFFGKSVLPHWVLLYTCLTIPFGTLIQRGMKYVAWKERWQKRHPEVHEQ